MTDPRLTERWRNKRCKTPVVLQMEGAECGAAALASILAYHGRWEPLETLRVECGVSRDGSKANNILQAARRYGLDARGFKAEPDALRELPLPMILYWNFNHFVVLEGVCGTKVFLNDPSCGPRRTDLETLNKSFTGVALTFTPGPDFQPNNVRPSVGKGLRRRFQGNGLSLLYIVTLGCLLALLGLVIPGFSRIFVDQIVLEARDNWLKPLLLAMAAAVLLQGCIAWMQRTCLLRFQLKLSISQSTRFLHHVLRLPIRFHEQRYAGDLTSRVMLNDSVAELLSGQLATTIVNLVAVSLYLVVMYFYSPALTAMALAAAIGNALMLRLSNERQANTSLQLQQAMGRWNGFSMCGVNLIETLKASGGEQDFFAEWAGHQAKVVTSQQQLAQVGLYIDLAPVFLGSLCSVLVLAYGGLLIIRGELSIGELLAFQLLLASFLGPFNSIVGAGGMLQQIRAALVRLDDVFACAPDPRFAATDELKPAALGVDQPASQGLLEFCDVSFGYSPLDPPLIQDFTLRLAPGSRIALVGGSGSGKSTLARLATGQYVPWTGQILLDGKPLSNIPPLAFAQVVTAVDQDIRLFAGTVEDNLRLWDETIDINDMLQAAKDAAIHEDIMARPGGYKGPVTEGGGNFSGGQRQRLEIARALARNPRALIMDEATSALDPSTEEFIDANLRRRGCACLIVAHRLSAIRDCDEILVLDKGQVAERGTHEELMRADGRYANLLHTID